MTKVLSGERLRSLLSKLVRLILLKEKNPLAPGLSLHANKVQDLSPGHRSLEMERLNSNDSKKRSLPRFRESYTALKMI